MACIVAMPLIPSIKLYKFVNHNVPSVAKRLSANKIGKGRLEFLKQKYIPAKTMTNCAARRRGTLKFIKSSKAPRVAIAKSNIM